MSSIHVSMAHQARARRVAPLLAAVAAWSCTAPLGRHAFVAQPSGIISGLARPSTGASRFVQVPVQGTGQQRAARAVATLCTPSGQLTRNIKATTTYHELLRLFEAERTDMVHRATILFQLSQMVSECPSTLKANSLSEDIAKAPACRALLLAITGDLSKWKASGSLKSRQGKYRQSEEQGRYLANLVGSLDKMRRVLHVSLSEDERSLMFQRATLAALEALPDLVDSTQTLHLRQIVHGLRHTKRNLQSDMIFASLADYWPRLLTSEQDLATGLPLVLNAYGMYGATGRPISNMFTQLQSMTVDMDLDCSQIPIGQVSRILTACARYAIAYKERAGQPDTFSITVDKRGTYKLGFAMNMSRAQRFIKVAAIAEGLVKRWNKQHPDWKVSAGDEIIMANAVSSSPELIADEILASDVVTLLLRRGKVSVEVSPRTATRSEFGLEEIVDKSIMRAMASKALLIMQREWSEGDLTLQNLVTAITIVGPLAVLDVDHEQLFEYLGPRIKKGIPRLTPSLIIVLLWGLGIKNVFGESRVVTDLASQGLELLERGGLAPSERKVFIPIAFHSLKGLSCGPAPSVMKKLRKASEREGITNRDLEHPKDYSRYVLWDTKGSVALAS